MIRGDNMKIGDRVKVINQNIMGIITEEIGTKVIIIDDDAETIDDTLEYKKSELKLL